jgi:hypothetical protein
MFQGGPKPRQINRVQVDTHILNPIGGRSARAYAGKKAIKRNAITNIVSAIGNAIFSITSFRLPL